MTESTKSDLMTKLRRLDFNGRSISDLSLDELIDIKLYITRYKLERGLIS